MCFESYLVDPVTKTWRTEPVDVLEVYNFDVTDQRNWAPYLCGECVDDWRLDEGREWNDLTCVDSNPDCAKLPNGMCEYDCVGKDMVQMDIEIEGVPSKLCRCKDNWLFVAWDDVAKYPLLSGLDHPNIEKPTDGSVPSFVPEANFLD